MDWNQGIASSCHVGIVDRDTWLDTDSIPIMDGRIARSEDGILHTADITCRQFPVGKEILIRIWEIAMQNGESNRVAVFTGFATAPQTEIDGRIKKYPLKCYSVLQAADDMLLPLGWYAPVGVDVGLIIKELLSVTHAPIEVKGEIKTLKEAVVSEDNETRLSMAHKILDAAGKRLRLDGMGCITIEDMPTLAVAKYDPNDADAIEPQVTIDDDWYKCPNVFRAVNGNTTAIAKDESDSILSISQRGREVWMGESSSDYTEDETLSRYALRRLQEEQERAFSVKYDRRYNPDVFAGDLVWLNYPLQGIQGVFRVKSQTVNLGYGLQTAEEVVKVSIDAFTATSSVSQYDFSSIGRIVIPGNNYVVVPGDKRSTLMVGGV